jgi:ribosome-binding factor A
MKKDRLLRVNELIRRGIGTLLFEIVHENSVDLSGITITHVITTSDLKTARVLVSVRDEDQRQRVMGLLSRQRARIQEELSRRLILKYTPRLSFVLDTSLAEGDRILELLARMEAEQPKEEVTDDGDSPPPL